MSDQTETISEALATVGMDEAKALSLKEAFTPFFNKAREWAEKASAIKVQDVSQKAEIKQAKEARLQLKKIRTSVESLRKELKENIVKEGKAIDGVANIIKDLIKPTEEYLLEQEKFAERLEAERKVQLKRDRLEELAKHDFDGQLYPLAEMPEEAYQEILATAKANHERKLEERRRAEEERLENERIQKLHVERKAYLIDADLWRYRESWLDNECLADLSDERWVSLKNDLGEAKAAEVERQEKLRVENERLKKEAAARAAKEEEERKAREAAEAQLAEELKARQRQEAIESQRRQDEAQAKRAAEMAPDKDKLTAFAKMLESLEKPDLKSPEANEILSRASRSMISLINRMRQDITSL